MSKQRELRLGVMICFASEKAHSEGVELPGTASKSRAALATLGKRGWLSLNHLYGLVLTFSHFCSNHLFTSPCREVSTGFPESDCSSSATNSKRPSLIAHHRFGGGSSDVEAISV